MTTAIPPTTAGSGSELDYDAQLSAGAELRRQAGRNAGAIVMPPAASRFTQPGFHRWGLVLAGGDGLRLRPLTRAICGDERPKQFCPMIDGKSLLHQTVRRVQAVIPREQILVTLNGEHCKWYLQEPEPCPNQRIVQPANRGTAPAIAHALLSLAAIQEDAMVAIFPSDHHFSDDAAFAASLEAAFAHALEHRGSVVLLGARPDYPETDYGWIEPGQAVGGEPELFHVRAFKEKPVLSVAKSLLAQNALWNTFVMTGHVKAFLNLLGKALPKLVESLGTARRWAGAETHIEYSVYQHLAAVDFCKTVLPAATDHLLALRFGGLAWNDLGDPRRASRVIRRARASGVAA